MKKILLLVLAATLVCSASLFTACSVANDDNAAGVTPVQSRVGYSAWHTQVSYTRCAPAAMRGHTFNILSPEA